MTPAVPDQDNLRALRRIKALHSARHNKTIFGSLYVAGLLYTWWRWPG